MNVEELLRRALAAQAGRGEVTPDALDSIRAQVGARVRLERRLARLLAAPAPSAAARVTAVLIGLGACAPPSTPPNPADTTPVATSVPDTLEPSPTSTLGKVPVYFVAEV